MSTEIATRAPGEVAVPEHARALGQRVKPIIRLGMGIKDPERGFPRKTDHFTVRGDERAVAKFREVYGEKPKAVKIMVPSELGLALDISYRSFVGGGDDDGGRPLALGFTNFATLGFVGGPDVLRVWRQDGTYEEVETLGLDELGKPLDALAEELAIAVHATFTFTIPEVLGWGSFAAVTSKGKKSADNLVYKLSQIYGAFGAKAPFAFSREEPPMLVLKPDTAMMRFEDKDGKARWGKTSIFVLDIVIPEAFDDMVDRLAERQASIAPAGPAAALYGRELPEGEPLREGGNARVETPHAPPSQSGPQEVSARAESEERAAEGASRDDQPPFSPEAADGNQHGASAAAPAEPEPDLPGGFNAPDAAALSPEVIAANAAAEFPIPTGKWKGLTLREVADKGADGAGWLRWCLRHYETDPLKSKVWQFCRVYAPDLFEQVTAEKEVAAS